MKFSAQGGRRGGRERVSRRVLAVREDGLLSFPTLNHEQERHSPSGRSPGERSGSTPGWHAWGGRLPRTLDSGGQRSHPRLPVPLTAAHFRDARCAFWCFSWIPQFLVPVIRGMEQTSYSPPSSQSLWFQVRESAVLQAPFELSGREGLPEAPTPTGTRSPLFTAPQTKPATHHAAPGRRPCPERPRDRPDTLRPFLR